MSEAARMNELIARLKAAGEGSRELDSAIAVTTFKTVYVDEDMIYAQAVRKDDNCASGTFCRKSRSGAYLQAAPHYTTSIDAALTLVPAGSSGAIAWSEHCTAICSNTRLVPEGKNAEKAATLPLALCIAALKARAASR